jgi:anti-anti-sigma regulatory factor
LEEVDMRKTKKKKSDSSGSLVLGGKITIKDISELRESLLSRLASSDELVLDLRELEEGDLTFYQLLCSTLITAERMNKKVVCHTHELRRSDTESSTFGFCDGAHCNGKGNVACIWNRLN